MNEPHASQNLPSSTAIPRGSPAHLARARQPLSPVPAQVLSSLFGLRVEGRLVLSEVEPRDSIPGRSCHRKGR